MALTYFYDGETCIGQSLACDCTRCAIEQEHDADAYEAWRREEILGPPVWASEGRRGVSAFPHARSGRPAAPLAGFHQLGDDADGEGWS